MGEKWGGGRSAKSSVRVVARLFVVPILKIVVQLWPPVQPKNSHCFDHFLPNKIHIGSYAT